MPEFLESHPAGYPLILFVHHLPETTEKTTFSLAKTKLIAQQNNREATTERVNILNLTASWGHKETHSFLKKFGNEWVCKTGTIYYKEVILRFRY